MEDLKVRCHIIVARGFFSAVTLIIAALTVSDPVFGQSFVTPGSNTNIVGVTPDELHIPDYGLKQQQEPSCIIRSSNRSYIFCAYNDMRASDQPEVQGDGWIGVSMSGDSGETWFSRLTPGFKGDLDNSLNMGFAADPSVVTIPGNSPGLAVLNFIGGFRDSNNGVLAVQRWVEMPLEDGNFWLPETEIHRPSDGTSGRFIDKPAFYYLPDAVANQGTITQDIFVEGFPDSIPVTTPTGTLYVAYAVFTGSSSVKVLLQYSRDNGITWSHKIKLSEDQNEVTGVSLTSVGQDIVAIWRRKGDNNNSDAIMTAYCSKGGTKCAKATVLAEACPFDQPATGASFRSFTFPWAATDGSRAWAFWADRRFAGDPSCTALPSPAPIGTFSGIPRIVGMSSADGKNWVGGDSADSDQPFVVDANFVGGQAVGYQVIPSAFGTIGRVDLAWYDTRREEPLPPGNTLPTGEDLSLINDYLTDGGLTRVFRKADVWMTRLSGAHCGNSPQATCAPVIQPSVRVSQYPFFFLNEGINIGQLEEVGQEVKAHKPNLRLYASGTLAFKGDYIAVATAAARRIQGGQWIPNYEPEGARGPELPGFIEREDVFVAWGDNQDVFADFVGPTSAQQLPYTPTTNSAAGLRLQENPATDPEVASSQTMLAMESGLDAKTEIETSNESLVAASEPDDDPSQTPDTEVIPGGCTVTSDFSRARDANVYGSLVADEASLKSPITTKPLTTVQRMFPVEMHNPSDSESRPFCLVIEDQPGDAPVNGRASFFQLPATGPFINDDGLETALDVNVPPNSSVSRAVFIVTGLQSTLIPVSGYDGTCDDLELSDEPVSSLLLGDGALLDPAYCADPIPPDRLATCLAVSQHETHNINLLSPNLQAPILQAPILQASGIATPNLQAPILQAPNFQAPNFQAPNLQAPILQAPNFQANQLLAPNLQAPNLQAPNLQAPNLQAALLAGDPIVYQDVTFVVNTDANVTSTYSADIALSGLNTDDVAVQLIAWTPNVYGTSEGCQTQPTADYQVIAAVDLGTPNLQAVNLPSVVTATNQNPYAGAVSFTGTPGLDVAITARIWAAGDTVMTLNTLHNQYQQCLADQDPDLSLDEIIEACSNAGVGQLVTLGASSQSCNTNAFPNPNDPQDCLDTEKIFQDKLGPTISPADGTAVSVEADSSAGAIIDTPGGVPDFVSAEDPSGVDSLSCSSSEFALGNTTSTVPFSTVDPVTGELVPATIDCTAEDELHNVATASIGINVTDNFAPTLIRGMTLLEVEAAATSGGIVGAFVDYTSEGQTFVATDAIAYPSPTSVTPDCTPASGSFLPLGTTTVSCTVSDNGPNAMAGVNTSAPVEFDVEVQDMTAPTFTFVPAAISAEADGEFTMVIIGMAMASDISPVVVTSNAPGTGFPLGLTVVTWTATDSSGNVATAVQNVTVSDSEVPELTAPADITTEATGAFTDVDIGMATATDEFAVTIVNDAPASFPVGVTPVTWTATDANGNVAAAIQTITVTDNTAPVITAGDLNFTTLGMTAEIDYVSQISATDLVDPAPALACNVAGDATNPFEFPLGDTVVSCTATDSSGNETTEEFTVNVSFIYLLEMDRIKGRINAGSTVPLDFRYVDPDTEQPINSSAINPVASWIGPYGPGCSGGDPGPGDGEDSGSSSYRYTHPTWQFSWQTPSIDGWYLLTITPPGFEGFSRCVRLR